MRHRRSRRLDRAQGERDDHGTRVPSSDLDVPAAEAEALIMAARRQAGLDRATGTRAEEEPAAEPARGLRRTGASMDDGAGRTLSERMCIVTREVMDEDALIRFVRSPDGEAVPDLQRHLAGAGCLGVAEPRQGGRGTAQRPVLARFSCRDAGLGTLPELVGDLLRKAALSYLPLARKAGEAVCGFMKVDELWPRQARVLIHAAGSPRRRPAQACCAAGPERRNGQSLYRR